MAAWLKARGRTALLTALLVPGAVAAQDDETAYVRWGGLSVLGDAPNYFDVGAGVFDLRTTNEDESGDSGAVRAEVRGGKKLWFVGPAVGLMANTDGGVFDYGGIYADVAFGKFVVTPLVAIGGYRQGQSSDLGGVFQFRSSLGVSYEFENRHRLGLNLGPVDELMEVLFWGIPPLNSM